MLRSNGFTPNTKTINIVLMDGGLGDHIAALPAIKYICNQYPWITPLVWMPNFLVEFAKHVLPEDIQIKGFSAMRRSYHPARSTKTTKWDGATSPMKIHCVDYAFLKLTDENPAIEHKNYLKIDSSKIDIDGLYLPERYLVLTTGFTAKVREMPAKSINEVAKWAIEQGLKVVFLGQKQTRTGALHVIKGNFDDTIDFSVGVNLIDKTSLLQAAAIMSRAVVIVGVDNGLLHVAGCTDTPIVGGFTTVSPEIRMPIRNNTLGYNYYAIVPEVSLGCRFCQQKTNFLFGHDYSRCIYRDNACVSHMRADKFIDKLKIVLKL